jgi:transposase-like protein
VLLKPLLGLVFNSQKCCHTFVNWYYHVLFLLEFGVAEIAIPRDRQGEFEPQLVKKGQSRLSGLDEKIIAL